MFQFETFQYLIREYYYRSIIYTRWSSWYLAIKWEYQQVDLYTKKDRLGMFIVMVDEIIAYFDIQISRKFRNRRINGTAFRQKQYFECMELLLSPPIIIQPHILYEICLLPKNLPNKRSFSYSWLPKVRMPRSHMNSIKIYQMLSVLVMAFYQLCISSKLTDFHC